MNPDHCQVCRDLFAECGKENWPLYSKKLLKSGWAGHRSPVEDAFIKAHKTLSEAQQKAREQAGRRMAKIRPTGARGLATQNED